MEMKVYIANLGKYNEGKLVGAWFTPPIDYEDMAERIGLNSEYEEYAIHDYELPFSVGEYTPISEINRLCEAVEEIDGLPIYAELKEIQSMWFSSFDELIDNLDKINCYSDCYTMADFARYYVEETGMFGEIPAKLQYYIDYVSLGRDIELEGDFLVTSSGVFECVG